MRYTGQLVTGDFEENTMTFEIEGEMILQAGKYSIEQIEAGKQVKNLGITNFVGQSEQLPTDDDDMKDKILDIVAEHCVGRKNCDELTEKLFDLYNKNNRIKSSQTYRLK